MLCVSICLEFIYAHNKNHNTESKDLLASIRVSQICAHKRPLVISVIYYCNILLWYHDFIQSNCLAVSSQSKLIILVIILVKRPLVTMNIICMQVDGLNWGVEGHIEYTVLSHA
jgi:hypothetical protein